MTFFGYDSMNNVEYSRNMKTHVVKVFKFTLADFANDPVRRNRAWTK